MHHMNYGLNDMQMRMDGKENGRNKSKTRGEEDPDEAINLNDVQL